MFDSFRLPPPPEEQNPFAYGMQEAQKAVGDFLAQLLYISNIYLRRLLSTYLN
jgi:hypothetical protein